MHAWVSIISSVSNIHFYSVSLAPVDDPAELTPLIPHLDGNKEVKAILLSSAVLISSLSYIL